MTQGYPVRHSGVREIDGLTPEAVFSGQPPTGPTSFVEQKDVDKEVNNVVPKLKGSNVERLPVRHQSWADDLREFHLNDFYSTIKVQISSPSLKLCNPMQLPLLVRASSS